MEQEKEIVKGSTILSVHPKQDREYRVKTYDFKRPDKFSLDQIKTLSTIHETFSRLFTLSLSAQIQKKVEVQVRCVDQMTFAEFLQSQPNPTSMAIIGMSPLKGTALLEIDPNISSVLLNRMFGGPGEPLKENIELTLFERSTMEMLVKGLLVDLKTAWKPIIDLNPFLGQIETVPQRAQIVPPSEMVILISLKMKIGDTKGYLNLCLPFLTIEPILGKLSAQYWYSMVKNRSGDSLPENTISSLQMDSEIIVETEKLSLKRLGELKKGSLVKMKHFGEGQASLRMGGQHILKSKFKRSRKGTNYSINGEGNIQKEEILNLLHREEIKKEDIRGEFHNLSQQLDNLTEKLTGRIDELVDSQEHLTDQVFLQGGDEQVLIQTDHKPLSFLINSDRDRLYQLLAEENRQLIALILSLLDSGLGARLLEMFDAHIQPELIKRIGLLDRVTPEVIKGIEKLIHNSFNLMTESLLPDVSGVKKAVEILNVSSRAVEKNVINNLDQTNKELAEEIKNRLFVFEDIVLLDGPTVTKIAESVELEDLCLSLKIVSDERVQQHIFRNVSPELYEKLETCLKEKGRVKISDVDKAQLRIVSKIRELEEMGEVVVARPDELVG